jgi:hypothetical protein
VLGWEVVILVYLQLCLRRVIKSNIYRAIGKTGFWAKADNGVEVESDIKEGHQGKIQLVDGVAGAQGLGTTPSKMNPQLSI